MIETIHCDLMDINGVNWDSVDEEKISCIIEAIHSMELISNKNELFGFVGTTDVDGVVGGFFVIQFPTEFLTYGRDKTARKAKTIPAERVFFVLFPSHGRVLLQNRRFQILPINMEVVLAKFKETLARVLLECRVGPVVSLIPTSVPITRRELLEAYDSSTDVMHLHVPYPNPRQIPEDFPYYNPRRERNEIIRDSRYNDYPKLSEIDIVARKDHDLRETHLGQDLVHAVRERSDFAMTYRDRNGERQVLRRLTKAKFEFSLDVDSEEVSEDTLVRVMEILRQEAALKMGISHRPKGQQLPLF